MTTDTKSDYLSIEDKLRQRPHDCERLCFAFPSILAMMTGISYVRVGDRIATITYTNGANRTIPSRLLKALNANDVCPFAVARIASEHLSS